MKVDAIANRGEKKERSIKKTPGGTELVPPGALFEWACMFDGLGTIESGKIEFSKGPFVYESWILQLFV